MKTTATRNQSKADRRGTSDAGKVQRRQRDKVLMSMRLAREDAQWFEDVKAGTLDSSAALFRRMRLAFERVASDDIKLARGAERNAVAQVG